jgi:hypothetical protein
MVEAERCTQTNRAICGCTTQPVLFMIKKPFKACDSFPDRLGDGQRWATAFTQKH